MRIISFRFLLPLSIALFSAAAHAERAVFVVRHAEKASQSEKDPVLSLSGEDRALNLTTFLRAIPVEAIFATELRRTQLTVQPLADLRGKKLTIVKADDTAGLVKQIRALPADAVAVVSGHSNTIPLILEALGVKEKVAVRDDQYSRVFLVTPLPGGAASLLELHYGG